MTQHGTQRNPQQALATTIGLAGTILIGGLATLAVINRLEEEDTPIFKSDACDKTLKQQLFSSEFDPDSSVAEFLASRYMLLLQMHKSGDELSAEEAQSLRNTLASYHEQCNRIRPAKAETKLQKLLDPSLPDEGIDFAARAKKSLAGIILSGRPGFNPEEDFDYIAAMLRFD